MKKKSNTNKQLSKGKVSEQKLTNNNNHLLNNEFTLIIHKFYDSFSKYLQSMKNCLKEINVKIVNNNSISLDEASTKCISSLNIIFGYLDSSFTQFYSNLVRYFEKINANKYAKIGYTNKNLNLLKNSSSTNFYNENNFPNNIIYINYQKNRIETKNILNKNQYMNKMNTTSDLNKKDNSINETVGNSKKWRDLSLSSSNNKNINNLIEESMPDKDFVENVKNLLNILKYEKISELNNSRKSQYQLKLDKFKENLITEISNSMNDVKDINPQHRRIKSVNLSSKSINYINNIYNDNEFNKNNFIIQENDEKNINDLTDEISNEIKEKNKSFNIEKNNNLKQHLTENNIFENNKNNLNIINNIKININKTSDNLMQLENEKIKNENDILEKNKKDLLMQIADLITKNNTLTEEVSILKNANIKLSESEKKTNDIIDEKNKKIESIIDSKNELEKNNIQLKNSLELYESEIVKLKKEKKKLIENINTLSNIENENKTNIKINKELTQENKNLEKELFELEKEIEKLNNQINNVKNKKEEYEEKYKKVCKELNDEKGMNMIFEQKIKTLEKKLEEHNINEFDDGKTKTYKLNCMNKVNEIEVEKLSRKYVSPYNYRKNTSAISTNNTSNTKKIIINNNLDEFEITPENYIIVKCYQLNNNLKWYLLKKNKKQNMETESSPLQSPSQSNSKQLFRRYKYLKINSKLFNESYSDYIWKPSRNDRDFINFNYATNDNNDNYKNDKSNSNDKQRKINELECCIRDLEEKLEKKENDCNRINLNLAKMFKKSKHPELNYDTVLENNEKLKAENKNLKRKIDNLKATQNFIGLSFIEDDLEGSRFIDDKCFEEILDELIGNTHENIYKKANTYKRIKDDKKFEINMMKFFRSHEDDNDNRDKDNINNDNIKEDLNEGNNDDNNKNNKYRDNKSNKNEEKFEGRQTYYKKSKYSNKNDNNNNNENNNEKIIDIKTPEKADNNRDNQNDIKTGSIKTDSNKNDNKKYLSYRFSRYKQRVNTTQKENKKEHKNTDSNYNYNNDNEDKYLKKVNFKSDKKEHYRDNFINEEQNYNNNQNKLTDTNINKKMDNDDEKINKNIFINTRKVKKSYRRHQNENIYTDYNKNNNNNINDDKKNEYMTNNKKEEKKENKPYRSLKSMKIEIDYKYEKKNDGLQESSSQSNRVCFGRRFYKKKKDDLKPETNEK